MNWKKNILYIISLGCIAWMGGFLHVWFAADFGFGPDISWIEATEDVLVQWTSDNQEENIIDIVKSIVNIVLGVLALIALLFLMRWWFQMVTAAGNEDRYKKWWTILRTAAVWLFFYWTCVVLFEFGVPIDRKNNRECRVSGYWRIVISELFD